MLKASTYILVGLFMSQNADTASKRLRDVQLLREGKIPSSAVYELKGDPSPEFLGRHTTCRCYRDSNSYYVEEVCDFWVSRVWMFQGRFVWQYTDQTGQYSFIGRISERSSPDEFLDKKGFPISRISGFDVQCLELIRSCKKGRTEGDVFDAVLNGAPIRLTFRSDGFDIERASKPAITIKYDFAEALPDWKKETDSLLKEIESGKTPARALDKSFSFESVMNTIADEDAEQVKIPPAELPNVAQVNGYILPVGADINVKSATSSGHGRLLILVVEVGNKQFECAQYRLEIGWNDKGDLVSTPFSKEVIVKSQKLSTGQLLLVSNGEGAARSTCFIHRSGQTLSLAGDVFDDSEFRKMLAALRGRQSQAR